MRDRATTVVIGAGIIGASIAYNLARRGAKNVVVVDESRAGSGSTAASLGGFRHQFSNELSVKLSIESIEVIEKFKELTGFDPLVAHDGYLFLATSEKSFSQLKENRILQESLGVSVDLLTPQELLEHYPFYNFDGVLGGTFCARDGHASTSTIHQGFITKAKELGVELYEDAEVKKIERGGSRVKGVVTTKGEIHSEKAVIAAGAFSGRIGALASVEIPIKPYPRKVFFLTRNLPESIPSQIPLIVDVDSTLALGRDGTMILFGDNTSTGPSFELSFPQDYEQKVISKLLRRVPSLSRASISHSVSGLYEMTPDANPISSEISEVEGLYCCAGFSGHGFMHSPAIGALMAELILDQKPHLDISSYHIKRFENKTQREQLVI